MIYTSHYKDQPAITLETGHVRAQFLPALGGKVSALISLDHNFDVLVHRQGPTYRLQPYYPTILGSGWKPDFRDYTQISLRTAIFQ